MYKKHDQWKQITLTALGLYVKLMSGNESRCLHFQIKIFFFILVFFVLFRFFVMSTVFAWWIFPGVLSIYRFCVTRLKLMLFLFFLAIWISIYCKCNAMTWLWLQAIDWLSLVSIARGCVCCSLIALSHFQRCTNLRQYLSVYFYAKLFASSSLSLLLWFQRLFSTF